MKIITKKEAVDIAEAKIREENPEMLAEVLGCPHKLGEPTYEAEVYRDDDGNVYWRVVYTREVEIHDVCKEPFTATWMSVAYVNKNSGECLLCA